MPGGTPTKFHPVSVRIQALALLTAGIPQSVVSQTTQIPVRSLQYLLKKARERGFDPAVDPRIMMEHVEDGKRTGRPRRRVLVSGQEETGSSAAEREEEGRSGSSVVEGGEVETGVEAAKSSSSSSSSSSPASGEGSGTLLLEEEA
ncbi:hypothetical protein VTN00DRAFT_615 [Thermoascus crustaceus]|uniref:uncharacterized protein n=1 Tax=Thermoascus crustaceus TaxID=5088 RepID=UPI0037420F27